MTDQADNLRRMIERYLPGQRAPHRARRIAFMSGKGGVGKTTLAVNTAIALARMGRATALVDCDLGLANADFLLGIQTSKTLDGVILSGHDVRKAVEVLPSGLWLVPGAGAIVPRQAVTNDRLESALGQLDSDVEFIIMDAAAGIDEGVQYVARLSDEVVVVSLPDGSAAVNAYRLIKVLCELKPAPYIRLVVNKSPSHSAALRIASGLQRTTLEFVGREIEYVGWIPADPATEQAGKERRPLIEKYPGSEGARSIVALARALLSPPPDRPDAA